jgi:hypothetical protein
MTWRRRGWWKSWTNDSIYDSGADGNFKRIADRKSNGIANRKLDRKSDRNSDRKLDRKIDYEIEYKIEPEIEYETAQLPSLALCGLFTPLPVCVGERID